MADQEQTRSVGQPSTLRHLRRRRAWCVVMLTACGCSASRTAGTPVRQLTESWSSAESVVQPEFQSSLPRVQATTEKHPQVEHSVERATLAPAPTVQVAAKVESVLSTSEDRLESERKPRPFPIQLASLPDGNAGGIEPFQLALGAEGVLVPPPPHVEGTGMALTLDLAISTTLAADPVISAGFESIRQSQADHLTASLKPNPELSIEQTLLPLTRSFVADEREGGPPQLDVMVEFPIDWYLFGKRAAAMQSAQRGVQASQKEYADLVRIRVQQTALAYYDLLEAEALYDLAQQDVENFRQVEEIARLGVENGRLPQVELNRIRLDRLNSQQEMRDAQRDLVSAQAALMEVMGIQSSSWNYEVLGELTAPLDQLPPSPFEAFQLAQQYRPDIEGMRWRVSEASANVEVERLEAYPEVVPMLGYTRQFQRRAIGFPDAHSWGIGVSLGLPFNDRNQGNQARAVSELMQSRHEYQAALVELNAEILALSAELETARVNAIATASDQLELAAQVRDSIRQAYELGARPLIDVLDSQRNFRETYRNYIESRASYWRAVHQFNATVGTPVLH